MVTLRERLQNDLTAAMRSRDTVRTATLRLALAAVSTEAVSGPVAREPDDAEVTAVLRRELKRRREAADAFAMAGRDEQAERERAEAAVLAGYLPAELTDDQLAGLVRAAIEETGARGSGGLGSVMKAVQPRVAGRAEGARVAAEVRRQLAR